MKLLKTSKYLIVLYAASLLAAQPPAQRPPAAQPPATQQPPKPPTLQPGTPGQPNPAAKATPEPPAPEVSPDTVVLTVGNEKMTRAQFEDLISALPENVRAGAAKPGPGRRQVAQQIVELRALAQEARKRKLDQERGVKQLMEVQADNVLAGTLAKQLQDDVKIDDAAIRAYYDGHKSQYERVKASHILIRFKGSQAPAKPGQKDLTEEEALAKAQELRKKLAAGGDFAAIAKAESDDAGSGANGGSLGNFGHGQMVPQFEQAAFSLPVGQISEPVKSPFGYHIIKVEERTSKTFDEVRPEIEKQLKPQMAREAIDKIKKDSQSTLDDNYFGK